ncbi:MAG: hypothetical protein AAGB06_03220, partial [Verrucomicrobiota bacterium]
MSYLPAKGRADLMRLLGEQGAVLREAAFVLDFRAEDEPRAEAPFSRESLPSNSPDHQASENDTDVPSPVVSGARFPVVLRTEFHERDAPPLSDAEQAEPLADTALRLPKDTPVLEMPPLVRWSRMAHGVRSVLGKARPGRRI